MPEEIRLLSQRLDSGSEGRPVPPPSPLCPTPPDLKQTGLGERWAALSSDTHSQARATRHAWVSGGPMPATL